MEEKIIRFISNINGQFVEVSSKSALYQCMDLVYLWVFVLGFPKSTIQQATASDVWTNANDLTRQYFDMIPNTKEFIAQAGDIFIIPKSTAYPAGHIGIIIEGTLDRIKRFEQNFPTGTNAHIEDRTYANIVGFLRPKNVIMNTSPQWLNTLLQERGLTLDDESEIRTLFDKAKRYDDEILQLQEQVKTTNEALGDKSSEVSNLMTDKQKLQTKVDELETLYGKAKSERDEFGVDNSKMKLKIEEYIKDLLNNDFKIGELNKEITELKNNGVSSMTFWQIIKLAFTRSR